MNELEKILAVAAVVIVGLLLGYIVQEILDCRRIRRQRWPRSQKEKPK